jgi:phosphoribosylformylglycinamidine synthase
MGYGQRVTSPAPFPNDPSITPALVKRHKLSDDEWRRVVAELGREPTYTELGVMSVMWSEHCSYKSSRAHLARLPTKGPRVIQGPGENAGVVDIGDGFAAVFKMESHNHPSFIEPYQGAATGVGGILRDVFTMGARPIANLDSLRFGRPDHPRTAALLRGVVAGVGGYGNCIGVPTVGGELMFDAAYDGNILVNAFTCGVVRTDRIFYGRATGVGNPVIYVGAKTGRDGIHGATMASDNFSASGPSQRPTVQVGDPFLEKLLLEACLEIFAEDVLVGVQDMGAAGLTSSSVEMAGRSGSGLDLDLDLVPRRARGLTPYEMLLSESQERMLMVAKPGCEARVLEICAKWELDASIIGRVTDTGRWVIRATPGHDPLADASGPRAPVVVCDLPVDFLTDAAPKYDRPQADDPSLPARRAFDVGAWLAARPAPSWSDELARMLSHPNVGSRRWVWRQYDHIVRGGTHVRPGGDAAVVRVPCEKDGVVVDKLLAFKADVNGRLCELDPFEGAAMAVAEVTRNLACVGAEAIGITDCLNFGNPERPEIMRQIARAIDGIAAGCEALDVPVVSGNVSLYNETDGRAILPTPTLAAVGLVRDPGDVVRSTFPRGGLVINVLGWDASGPLGGSEWLTHETGEVKGPSPRVDLDKEARLQRLLLELCRARPRLIESAHDISDGGFAVAIAECISATDDERAMVGAQVDISGGDCSEAELLFGEAPSRVIVSSSSTADMGRFYEVARAHGVTVETIGVTGGLELLIRRGGRALVQLAATTLRDARERCLDSIVGADPTR